jgi:hypothetical protein
VSLPHGPGCRTTKSRSTLPTVVRPMVNRPPHRPHEWPCSGPSWARGQSRASSTCLCRRGGRRGEHWHARRAGKVELRPRAAFRAVVSTCMHGARGTSSFVHVPQSVESNSKVCSASTLPPSGRH